MLEALPNSLITGTLLEMELYRMQFAEDLRVRENKGDITETCMGEKAFHVCRSKMNLFRPRINSCIR